MNVYLFFTLSMLVASFLCFLDAFRDRYKLTFYCTSILYGLILEKLVVLAFHRYTYPSESYFFTIFDIPLAIALGWSAILYSSFTLGKKIELSNKFLPVFTALFALHIDLSMDAIAIRVPFWSWLPPGPWFGVALINFFGWFLVAFLFTSFFILTGRLFRNRLLIGLSSLIASVVALIVLLQLWQIFAQTIIIRSIIMVVLIFVSLVFLIRSEIDLRSVSLTPFVSTMIFHFFFLGLLVFYGFYKEAPLLIPLSLAMLGIDISLHFTAFFQKVRQFAKSITY